MMLGKTRPAKRQSSHPAVVVSTHPEIPRRRIVSTPGGVSHAKLIVLTSIVAAILTIVMAEETTGDGITRRHTCANTHAGSNTRGQTGADAATLR